MLHKAEEFMSRLWVPLSFIFFFFRAVLHQILQLVFFYANVSDRHKVQHNDLKQIWDLSPLIYFSSTCNRYVFSQYFSTDFITVNPVMCTAWVLTECILDSLSQVTSQQLPLPLLNLLHFFFFPLFITNNSLVSNSSTNSVSP